MNPLPVFRTLPGTVAPLLVLLSFLAPLRDTPAADQPNILSILADDLGWADTTLFGHTRLP